MADKVKVYVYLLSQPARALYLICKILNIPHEVIEINMLKGEHKSDEYAKINPFKTIPSMKDGDIIINESCAALRHLALKYDKTRQWYPSNDAERARTDEYLHWQHGNTRKHGVGVFYNRVLTPMLTGNAADMDLVRSHAASLKDVEDKILNYFLKSGPFIGGQKPSIADISACVELEQPIRAGYTFSEPIQAYMKRVRTEIGEEYDNAHKAIWSIEKQNL